MTATLDDKAAEAEIDREIEQNKPAPKPQTEPAEAASLDAELTEIARDLGFSESDLKLPPDQLKRLVNAANRRDAAVSRKDKTEQRSGDDPPKESPPKPKTAIERLQEIGRFDFQDGDDNIDPTVRSAIIGSHDNAESKIEVLAKELDEVKSSYQGLSQAFAVTEVERMGRKFDRWMKKQSATVKKKYGTDPVLDRAADDPSAKNLNELWETANDLKNNWKGRGRRPKDEVFWGRALRLHNDTENESTTSEKEPPTGEDTMISPPVSTSRKHEKTGEEKALENVRRMLPGIRSRRAVVSE